MVKFRALLIFMMFAMIVFMTGSTGIFAQSDTPSVSKLAFEKSYNDYQIKLEEYKKAYPLYVSAKAQYLRAKSLKSEMALMEVGRTVLKLRDEVIIYHLDAIMKKYEDTDGANDDVIRNLNLKVEEEISWYQKHILSLPTASDLEDLTDDSDSAQDRKKTTDRLAYEIILNIAYATTEDYSTRFRDLLTEFTQKYDVIRAETREGYFFSSKKIQLLDRYIDEMEIINQRSNDKRSDIYKDILTARVVDEADYNKVIKSLIEATQYEKDATFKLIETIREIKYQEMGI